MALPLFAATLFVSAFLLFLVQPMIGKMILPKLGGTPQVWNTCMVFFQMALLAGYAYTHTVSTKLSLRRQLLVHAVLLFVPLLILLPGGPFNVTSWVPPPGANPIPATLLLLTIVVGIPFFVVATSAPLLQRWFAYTGHPASRDPYFLYGASNLGSMLALLAYPVLVEPLFRLQPADFANVGGIASFDLLSQNWLWTAGYLLLIVLVLCCAVMVWKAPPSVVLAGEKEASAAIEPPPPGAEMAAGEKPVTAPTTQIQAGPAPSASKQTNIRRGSKQRGRMHAQRPAPRSAAAAAAPAVALPRRPFEMTAWRRLRWVGLAAVPSSLMLGVTSYVSVDISPMPLLWVVPLALYLLSFIFVFMRWPVVWTAAPHQVVLIAQPLALLLLVWLQIRHGGFEPISATLVCLLGFFATALMCHGELARDRPPTRYLTEFYLWMSVGGMVGGMFNGLFAPLLFVGVAEFPLAIVFAGLMRPRTGTESWTEMMLNSLFPGLVAWLGDKGDEIARNYRKPAAATGTTAPAPRRELPTRGWLLSYGLDFVLPVFVVLAFWLIGSIVSLRWIFLFYKDTLAFAPSTAETWARATSQLLVFGIPLLGAFLFFGRPLRFGLAVGGLLLAGALQVSSEGQEGVYGGNAGNRRLLGYIETKTLNADRSYFGVLRVRQSAYHTTDGDKMQWYTFLMHGTTHHGLNYQSPANLRRVATTYYHRFGPTGVIMEKLNWFPLARDDYPKVGTFKLTDASLASLRAAAVPAPALAKLKTLKETDTEFASREQFEKEIAKALDKILDKNELERVRKLAVDHGQEGWSWHPFWADARLPVSVIGSTLSQTPGASAWGMPAVFGTLSEPPYATVGLGTGTMASYGRPFQHVVFYEIDDHIRKYSLPEDGSEPKFNYVQDAMKRGAKLEIIMGDARLSMNHENPVAGSVYPRETTFYPKRQNYYRAIELDAFSSDAIPVHLITKEAVRMYFEKLISPRDEMVEEKDDKGKTVTVKRHYHGGVLMVHTSNRHVDLVKPVTDVAQALGEEYAVQAGKSKDEWRKFIAWRVGKDHYKDDVVLARLSAPDLGRFTSEYVMIAKREEDLPPATLERERERQLHWSTPRHPGNRVWTDDYSNLLSVFRW